MNKSGFTLIEVLVAGALFLAMTAAFNLLLKEAPKHLQAAQKLTNALYEARSKMEALKATPAENEIEVIQVEVVWDPRHQPLGLYSLRSRYQ